MKIFLIISLLVAVVFSVWLIVICAKSKKPIKCFFVLLFLGLACLFAINLLSRFTGVKIPINIYTVGVGSMLSVPGIIGLLIMNILL